MEEQEDERTPEEIHRDAEESKRDAMTDAAKRFESETHVPLFYGTPEGAQTSAV